MKSQPAERISQVAEDLHEKGYHLQLETAFRQRKSGGIEGAVAAIHKVAISAEASGYVEVRFNAILQAGELEWQLVSKSDAPQARAADKRLETALELCRIAKRKPRNLHLFAQITRLAAELGVAAHKTFGLLMAWKAHVKRGDDSLWIAVLSFRVQQSLLATHKKYNEALRLAYATAKSRYRRVTARPVAEIAMAIGTLARVLESCGFKDAADAY